MRTYRAMILRTCSASLLVAALIGSALHVQAAPVTATAPFPFVPATVAGSTVKGTKQVRFNAFVNPLGGGIDVTRSTPTTGISYRSNAALTCTGLPPVPASRMAPGSGAPQLLNPAAEGDITLLCPFHLLSFGQSATADVTGIL